MATSHPERAPSAVDIEKALSGIQYSKTREELVDFAAGRVPDKELMNLIRYFQVDGIETHQRLQ